MEIKFLFAQLIDLEQIVQLLADDPLGSKREKSESPLPQDYISAFHNIDNDPNQELMVVKFEDEIIGTFQLSFIQYITYQGGIRAQLEGVRVKSSHRDKGIGGKILEYCIERSQERKAHLLQLTTDKKRPEALKFYESYGFVASHEGMKLHF